MANIFSPKLFQKVIQKGLKTALFTTSTAALMLSSSGALGAARTVTANGAELGAGTNIGPVVGAFVAGSTLQYTGTYTVTDADVSVRALDLNNFAAGLFSVTGDISLGSVVDTGGANKLPVSIDNGLTLTLTGTGTAAYGANPALLFQGGQAAANNTYTALGDIILNGANAGLTIASDPDVLGPITLAGTIDGDDDDHGVLTVSTQTNFTGAIGGTKTLNAVTFNNGNAAGGSSAGAISATTVTIGEDAGNNASVVEAGAITGAVNFANAGTLTVNGGITGAVTTAGNAATGGTLVVTAGDITNVGIGGNALTAVTFNNVAASNAGNIFATDITVNSATANVAAGTVNGAIDFAAAGKLSAGGLVTGTAVFNAAGELTLGAGITGAITTAANNGTVIVTGGDIADAGAAGNALTAVTFNNVAASNAGNIFATDVTVGNAGTDVTTGTVNGAIDFTAAGKLIAGGLVTGDVTFTTDGTLTANDGIDGAVTAAGGNGTLNTLGVGVTGAVGANGNSLKVLNAKVNNGAADLVFGSDIYAQTVNFDDVAGAGAVGTIKVGGNLIATTVNFSANAAGGVLEFNGPLDGGGDVILYEFKGAIANGANAILNVETANLTAYDPSIGTVAKINIGAGNLFAIEAGSGDVTILDGQAINFGDADSSLAFSNITGAATKNILLAGDLAAVVGNGGNLFFNGGANGLNIDSNKANTVRNIGAAAGNKFAALNIFNTVTVTKDINLAGILELTVTNGANFYDKSNSSVNIPQITIGVNGEGPGSYIVDTQGANNVDILAGGNQIIFDDADSILVLANSAAGNGTITLNAVLDPGAPNKGTLVVDSGAAGGKIILASAGNATYGTAVNKLKELEFIGTGTFQIDTDIFASDLELSVPAITYNKDINSNLTFGANTALTQNGNINGNVDFNNQAAVITLGAGKNITGSVTSSNGVNGTIIASGASIINGPITNLAMLKVGAGAVSITKGGDTSITEIQGNGTALLTLPADFKLTGAINATGGQALKLNFTNGGSVSGIVGKVGNEVGDITTAGVTSFASSVNAKGTATLGGTTSFADTFTNTGAVILAKGSTYNFAKDVTATSFKADGATMNFSNSLAFNSDITGSGTTLTLGANQVTYKGQGSFTDTLTLNTTFDGATNAGGNILIKSGSTLDLSGVSDLELLVTATNFDINDIDEDTKYTVISAETEGGLKPTPAENVKITINNDNRLVDFTFDASTLTLFAEDIAEEVIEEDFAPDGPLANIPNAPNVKKSLELMEQAPNGSDARLAFGNWGELTPIQEADAVSHLIQDVVKPSDTIAAINNQVIASNILSSLTNLNARMDAIQPAAVAAGDEDRDAKFGAWISPFVGNATQKMRNNISGYKADSTGGTIGFDGLVCDDLALGLAYTRADTDIKLKNNKTGDKNKVQSNIFSLYGLYNLPYENFFVEGIASYADNKIRSKSRRIIATGLATTAYQTANGKYKSESYTGQLMAGYTYAMPENINLTPLAGLRYSAIKDKGYKETGATYQNLIVKGKNYNSFDGLLGAKLSSNINVNEVVLTPELYAMVDYAFKNKVPAIDARLQGMAAPFPTNSFKPSKTSFDVGVGVTAKHKMMEYGINYDTNIGSKYFAQQGSVKVRVNF